jgi:ATP-dependent DNA helicase HFM1/MER3
LDPKELEFITLVLTNPIADKSKSYSYQAKFLSCVSLASHLNFNCRFINMVMSILGTTSTLSVGVNLPARCVIIRGTKTYRGGTTSRDGFEDYSELDLIQMMGRAGRPQFDDEGVAVVMTSQRDKMRIEKLVKSETTLESWFVRF